MRKFFLALPALTMAATIPNRRVEMPNSVAAIWYDPAGSAIDNSDLICHHVNWDGIAELRNEHRLLTIVVVHDNPVGNETRSTFTGHEEFSMSFVPSSTIDSSAGLTVGQYDSTPKIGKEFFFRLSPDSATALRLSIDTAPQGAERSVLEAQQVSFLSLDFNDSNYDDAQARSLTIDIGSPAA